MTDHICPYCQRPMGEHIDEIDCPHAIQERGPAPEVPPAGSGGEPTEGDVRQVGAGDTQRQSLAGTGHEAPGLHKATRPRHQDEEQPEIVHSEEED